MEASPLRRLRQLRLLPTVGALAGAVLVFTARSEPQAAGASVDWPQLTVTSVLTGLNAPVHLTNAGDGSGRVFIVEKQGRILVWGGSGQPTLYLDITARVGSSGSEQGLLSAAFPPNFATSGQLYVDYTNLTCKANGACNTTVSRFSQTSLSAADPASEEVLLTVDQPYPNHNGGQVAFGPDGYLYIGMGDGGSGGDPQNNAQRDDSFLGKLLRMNVATSSPGAEIVAKGLRNPWRFSFDPSTGDLYVADVGQNSYEEVDVVPGGNALGFNFGWRFREGLHCFNPASGCPTAGLTDPVTEYSHSLGCSITGGHVYRGSQYPRMQGVYFFSDYCSGRIWGLRRDNGDWAVEELLDTNLNVSSFGLDEAGNLYAVSLSGRVSRLGDAAPAAASSPTPSPSPSPSPAPPLVAGR